MKTINDTNIPKPKMTKEEKERRHKQWRNLTANDGILLETMYDNAYNKDTLFNLYELAMSNIAESMDTAIWIDVRELSFVKTHKATGWAIIGDKWLTDSKEDNMKLGRSIRDNGTYWPLFLKYNDDPETMEEQKYIILDGIHRIVVMYKLYEMGEWPVEKKILAYITNADQSDVTVQRKYKSPSELLLSSGTIKFRIQDSKKLIDLPFDDKTLLTKRMSASAKGSISKWSLILRNNIFEYEKRSKKIFYGHPLINDYSLIIEKEDMHKKLNQLYTEYFPAFIEASPFEIKYMTLKELLEISSIQNKTEWNNKADLYLTEFNIDTLAEDLINNGTYWPFVIFNDTKGIPMIYEGLHRYESLKKYVESGLIDPAQYTVPYIMINEHFTSMMQHNNIPDFNTRVMCNLYVNSNSKHISEFKVLAKNGQLYPNDNFLNTTYALDINAQITNTYEAYKIYQFIYTTFRNAMIANKSYRSGDEGYIEPMFKLSNKPVIALNKYEKKVEKEWGYEIWITTAPYVMKMLYIAEGKSIHLQYHEKKHETWYISDGKGLAIINGDSIILKENDYIQLPPGTIHKITGMSSDGITIIEASTTELEDVVHVEEKI